MNFIYQNNRETLIIPMGKTKKNSSRIGISAMPAVRARGMRLTKKQKVQRERDDVATRVFIAHVAGGMKAMVYGFVLTWVCALVSKWA